MSNTSVDLLTPFALAMTLIISIRQLNRAYITRATHRFGWTVFLAGAWWLVGSLSIASLFFFTDLALDDKLLCMDAMTLAFIFMVTDRINAKMAASGPERRAQPRDEKPRGKDDLSATLFSVIIALALTAASASMRMA